MTEEDYEYLLRTLSEARSRANEIALAVRERVGVDHRLSELGNSAVAQIESVLRDMRRVASEESDTVNSGGGHPASEAERKISTEPAKNNPGSLAPSAQAGEFPAEPLFSPFLKYVLQP